MADETKPKDKPPSVDAADDGVEVEVMPTEDGTKSLPKHWELAVGTDETIVVAGIGWKIDGSRIAPDEVTVDQIAKWHLECDQARVDVIRHVSKSFAYEYVIGRALYARRAAMKEAKDRTWLKWMECLPFSRPTAYVYIAIYEKRDQMLAGDQSSNALELPPTLTIKRLRDFTRHEKRQLKSGNVPPPPATAPPANPTAPAVQWPWQELYALRDKVIKTIDESPSAVALAHEVVTELLKKYGDPDWLERRRLAERMGLPLRDESSVSVPKAVVDDDVDSLVASMTDPQAIVAGSRPVASTLPPTVVLHGSTPRRVKPAPVVAAPAAVQHPRVQLVDKYRPMKFADVVGQDAAIKVLQGYATREMPIRLLLDGPSGSGKTTLAWIVARRWVCERRARTSPEPCEECDTCRDTKMMEHGDFFSISQVSAATALHSANATRGVNDFMHGAARFLIVNEADQMKDSALGLVQGLDLNKQISVIFCTCNAKLLDGKEGQFSNRLKVVKLVLPKQRDVAAMVVRIAAQEGHQMSEADALQVARDDGGKVRSPRKVLIELESVLHMN